MISLVGAVFSIMAASPADVRVLPSGELFLTPATERAIDRGLEFLARQSRKDGGLHNGAHPAGSTAIALLAFLANGHLPGKGEYGTIVKKGAEYLLKTREPYTGQIGQSMYEHGYAMLALADIWGELKDADAKLQEGIEAALLLAFQAQKTNQQGVWHYGPQYTTADISVTSAVLQGVRACREAYFEVPESVMDKASGFLIARANPDGGFGYMTHEGSNIARTGIGVMGLMACGQANRKEVRRGIEWLRKHPQLYDRPGYSAYYAVLAMYQTRTLVGEAVWEEWYPKIQQQILKMQQRDGAYSTQSDGGPVVETGLMTVALSIQKGLLPLFQR